MSEENRKFGLGVVLGWIGATAVVCASGGWTVGRVLLQDEIDQYEKAETWKAPEAISKMSDLSEMLTSQLAKITDHEDLKVNYKKQVKSNNELKVSLSNANENKLELNKQIEQLQRTLSLYQSDNIDIKVGEAKPVGHKSIQVGVSGTNPYTNTARVVSGNYKNSTMTVGDNFIKSVAQKNYQIILVKVDGSSTKFTYTVIDAKL